MTADLKIISEPPRSLAPQFHSLACTLSSLDAYPVHIYALCLRDFGEACLAALDRHNTVAAFVTGYPTLAKPERFFLWQIATGRPYQGQGLGKKMLGRALQAYRRQGARSVFATIDPANLPSLRLFWRLGFEPQGTLFGDREIQAGSWPVAHNHYQTGTAPVILVHTF